MNDIVHNNNKDKFSFLHLLDENRLIDIHTLLF
jgi:hypothetical protein